MQIVQSERLRVDTARDSHIFSRDDVGGFHAEARGFTAAVGVEKCTTLFGKAFCHTLAP